MIKSRDGLYAVTPEDEGVVIENLHARMDL
jgi:hypothetical protein